MGSLLHIQRSTVRIARSPHLLDSFDPESYVSTVAVRKSTIERIFVLNQYRLLGRRLPLFKNVKKHTILAVKIRALKNHSRTGRPQNNVKRLIIRTTQKRLFFNTEDEIIVFETRICSVRK